MPAISVAVPLFNKRNYIARSLASACRQTMGNFEIIVVDDGSTDGSGAIARSFPDKRIRVIVQQNRGASAARNRAMEEANGEVVAFLDADDEWYPEYLERITKLTQAYPRAGIFGTGFRRAMGREFDLEITLASPPQGYQRLVENFFAVASHRLFLHTSSVAVRRRAALEAGGFPEGERFGEDRDLWARIALKLPVAYDVRVSSVYHCAAEGRISDSRPRGLYYPPALRSLRKALRDGATLPHQEREVKAYIDCLHLEAVHHQIGHRNPAGARRLLQEDFFTRTCRVRALGLRLLLALLPTRAVEAVRLKPQNLLDRISTVRHWGDIEVRRIRPKQIPLEVELESPSG